MNKLFKSDQWTSRPLVEVATLQRGYDLPVQDRNAGPFPIFAANGPVGFHDTAKCEGPGVVTGRSGTIGKVQFVEGNYWPLNTSLYVTDFHGNHPKWVYYMLQSFGLEKYAQGAGVPTLNRNLVHHEPVLVPPLEEQRRIAAILDQAETLRTQRRTAMALLDSLTQSLFLDMFGDPVANPKAFSKQPLSVVAEITTGSTPGRGADGYYGGNIPWVKTTEVAGGEIHDTEEKLTEAGLKAIRGKLHPINSIVVAMYGQGQTRGRCALLRIEASCNQACGVIKPSEEFVPWFMFTQLLLAYERLRALGRGGNQENLNLQLLGSFEVLVPPSPSNKPSPPASPPSKPSKPPTAAPWPRSMRCLPRCSSGRLRGSCSQPTRTSA